VLLGRDGSGTERGAEAVLHAGCLLRELTDAIYEWWNASGAAATRVRRRCGVELCGGLVRVVGEAVGAQGGDAARSVPTLARAVP